MSFTEYWRWEEKVLIDLKQINRDYPIWKKKIEEKLTVCQGHMEWYQRIL